MNSAYAQNSQPGIPTRACQGHIVTTDLPTLGASLKQTSSESATQEAKDLGNLQWPGRTICTEGADCPRGPGRPSASTGRTVRKWHLNLQWRNAKTVRPCPTDGTSATKGLSALF
jgi:hypothetical protein